MMGLPSTFHLSGPRRLISRCVDYVVVIFGMHKTRQRTICSLQLITSKICCEGSEREGGRLIHLWSNFAVVQGGAQVNAIVCGTQLYYTNIVTAIMAL